MLESARTQWTIQRVAVASSSRRANWCRRLLRAGKTFRGIRTPDVRHSKGRLLNWRKRHCRHAFGCVYVVLEETGNLSTDRNVLELVVRRPKFWQHRTDKFTRSGCSTQPAAVPTFNISGSNSHSLGSAAVYGPRVCFQ